jgi:hypothetical protein
MKKLNVHHLLLIQGSLDCCDWGSRRAPLRKSVLRSVSYLRVAQDGGEAPEDAM